MGFLQQTMTNSYISPPPPPTIFYARNGNGGRGGGINGGTGGVCTNASSAFNGDNGAAQISPDFPVFPSDSYSYGGARTVSYSASTFSLDLSLFGSYTSITSPYSGNGGNTAFSVDTMDANGQGADAPALNLSYRPNSLQFNLGGRTGGINGLPGGNNRNDARGEGALGGGVVNSKPSDGSPGSVTVYKIF